MSAFVPTDRSGLCLASRIFSWQSLRAAWPLFIALAALAVVLSLGSHTSIARTGSSLIELPPATRDPGAPLAASPASVEQRMGYVTVIGEVMNRSSKPIANLEAVVEFFDADRRLLAVESALVEFSNLRAGEESPYRVQVREPAGVAAYRVRFRHLLGSAIPVARR